MSPGEKAPVCLYKGKLTDNLDSLPCAMFCQKVVSSKLYVKSEVLPPTAADRYHCLRVFYQVRQWAGESTKAISNTQMQPKYTDLGYAPNELLSQIRCKCKTTYLSIRCTYIKHGLICTPAYGHSFGISSEKSAHSDVEDCP